MRRQWIDRDLSDRVTEIISNASEYHAVYYESETFGGPSLHYHRRALEVDIANWNEKLELIYAVLASWGMHRMGSGGSKMQSFEPFKETVIAVKREVENLQHTTPNRLTSSAWDDIERVFKGIKVMESATTIVGNSKVMAHLLPNLIAPIDREYTLRYLFGSTQFANDLDGEWHTMRKILEEFYYRVATDDGFHIRSQVWLKDPLCLWDTSPLKVIDNLVIGAVRNEKRKLR